MNTIQKRYIDHLEDSWQKDDGIWNRTGAGSWITAQEVEGVNGWADDNPKWLSLEKVALAPILRILPATPRGTPNAIQTKQNTREHLVNSNLAHEENNNGLTHNSIEDLMLTICLDDELHSRLEEPLFNSFRNIFNDHDDHHQDRSHERNFGSTLGQAETFSNNLEHDALVTHVQVVENVGISIYGQQLPQASLFLEDVKRKLKIKLEMANIKLHSDTSDLNSHKENKSLEMKQMKAESEDQQDHDMSIQEVTLAAQQALAMVQSTLSSNCSEVIKNWFPNFSTRIST
ncbi:hypothetical protein DFH28DRAFT_1077702 [Melampsora americana]|nr:hypothetical protein DFH28DRAFT_1077702 [Melampsora americana]